MWDKVQVPSLPLGRPPALQRARSRLGFRFLAALVQADLMLRVRAAWKKHLAFSGLPGKHVMQYLVLHGLRVSHSPLKGHWKGIGAGWASSFWPPWLRMKTYSNYTSAQRSRRKPAQGHLILACTLLHCSGEKARAQRARNMRERSERNVSSIYIYIV